MKRPDLWHVPLLLGLLIGVVLGLVYSWGIAPVKFYDTAPNSLRPDLKDGYILLISEAYAADGDWPAAQARLAELGESDLPARVQALVEAAIAEGQPLANVRHLAALASQMGIESSAMAPFIATRGVPATPTMAVVLATFTPTAPPLPTVTPTPLPTPLPTSTPRPTATPRLSYQLVEQQAVCLAEPIEPMLQIVVQDAAGDDLPGIAIDVTWASGSTRFYTGFKPELGRGYADMMMEPGISYAVQVAGGGELVSGIQPDLCQSSAGPRYTSTRLVFEEIP